MMERMRMLTRPVLSILLILGSVGAVLAGDSAGELGILGGVFLPDRDVTGEPQTSGLLEQVLGLQGGYFFHDQWGWFADVTWTDVDTATPALGAQTFTVRSGVELLSAPHDEDRQTFFRFGGGWLTMDFDQAEDLDRSFVSLGVGQRHRSAGKTRFRWELRGDHTISDQGLGGDRITRAQFLVGLGWGFAGSRSDSDGDGVRDGRDRCPDTPQGATVDAKGCPADGDGDGVYDGIDKCPDTPGGWPVDDRGCPKDSDGDGVSDGADKCPDTPKGATVDADGCPEDSDGDGVYDGIDKCPDTPKGAKVDGRGCPTDSDGDGVPDGLDHCADTPKGATVDARGCPKDSDGDGVYDGVDKCPGTPAGTPVDAAGCPKAKPLIEEERRTLVLEGVQFEVDSAKLTAGSAAVLDRVAESLLGWPEVRIEVGGYTDSSGSDAYNLKLSERRAAAAREYLTGKGVAGNRMTSRGYGEANPIGDNGTKTGRAKNRRVELKRLD